ncbi:glycosyltransferase family 61 protein [Paenibacillus aceris]|uniref:Capsular polysaccharide biosynthesis protein n=1 Tax=Paenibacillus aceris TaxID=869555 RepID=A0ABS4I7Q4_9BACL|nr:glycosyltransferase family 61 protein [Paenibacillus aceris]MBP1966970.1 capsular polysaccharide biosynthesis protein [Paenibacillus aceris]NHW39334.1 glycosyltransferase family 61 protein [Paenibacillus aceris]
MGNVNKTSIPDGYYTVVKEWIRANGLRKKKHMKKLDFGDPIDLIEPVGLEDPTFWTVRFSEAGKPFKQRNGIVDIIPQGIIYGTKPDVMTPDHKLVWSHSREKHKLPEEHSIFQLDRLPALKQTSSIIALLSIKDSGIYYHWMMDVLPRLHMLKVCGIKPDQYVINGTKIAPFQYETLEALGIPKDKVIESHEGLCLQAKQLVIPYFTRGIRPKWAADFLKQELMINKKIKPVQGYERLFISRSKARKRMLLNESDIYDTLEPYGFQYVILEDLTVAQQIQLFASAKVIVAPHGAGLTNAVFSPPGTTIIELCAPSLVHNCYPILSSLVGHKHYYVIGEGERPPEYIDPHDRSADIAINMDDFREIMSIAGIT